MARYVDEVSALVKRTQAKVAQRSVKSDGIVGAIRFLHESLVNQEELVGGFKYWEQVPLAANRFNVSQEQLLLAWANEFNEERGE